jgi:hypothetical protein
MKGNYDAICFTPQFFCFHALSNHSSGPVSMIRQICRPGTLHAFGTRVFWQKLKSELHRIFSIIGPSSGQKQWSPSVPHSDSLVAALYRYVTVTSVRLQKRDSSGEIVLISRTTVPGFAAKKIPPLSKYTE